MTFVALVQPTISLIDLVQTYIQREKNYPWNGNYTNDESDHSCTNDGSYTDPNGNDCSYYDDDEGECGEYDDDSLDACCICQGYYK